MQNSVIHPRGKKRQETQSPSQPREGGQGLLPPQLSPPSPTWEGPPGLAQSRSAFYYQVQVKWGLSCCLSW